MWLFAERKTQTQRHGRYIRSFFDTLINKGLFKDVCTKSELAVADVERGAVLGYTLACGMGCVKDADRVKGNGRRKKGKGTYVCTYGVTEIGKRRKERVVR